MHTPKIFQSTLPHGSDVAGNIFNLAVSRFQSTLPHGSDGALLLWWFISKDFNPRSLTGATNAIVRLVQHIKNFNPRSLTGATLWSPRDVGEQVISIHAPSRERLSSMVSPPTTFHISIHAPSRERPMCSSARTSTRVFQSTLPHGSDTLPCIERRRYFDFNPRSLTGATNHGNRILIIFDISIHAPSRERRRIGNINLYQYEISIHAPSRERRTPIMVACAILPFQSTLPHGSDFHWPFLYLSLKIFQSTLPHGSDWAELSKWYNMWISIHAPSRERPDPAMMFPASLKFQSTLPHGSD